MALYFITVNIRILLCAYHIPHQLPHLGKFRKIILITQILELKVDQIQDFIRMKVC